jgi:hypothetical protein
MEIVFNMIFINLYIHMYLIIRCGELYGEFKKTTMEWKDDLMRVVMLDNMFKIKQKKIIIGLFVMVYFVELKI